MKVLIPFIALIAAVIGSGMISWNFIEPESFGGALVFLAIWAALSAIFRFILGLILMALFENN